MSGVEKETGNQIKSIIFWEGAGTYAQDIHCDFHMVSGNLNLFEEDALDQARRIGVGPVVQIGTIVDKPWPRFDVDVIDLESSLKRDVS